MVVGEVSTSTDVLVIGGGPIGILCAMVARDAGGKVTLSEVNPNRLAIAEKLGFDTVNPAKEDLAAAIKKALAHDGPALVEIIADAQLI